MPIAKRWTIVTLVSVLASASVGASAVLWLMGGPGWNASDLGWLLGIVATVSAVGAALFFLPLTWLASFVATPGRVFLPPLFVAAFGFGSYVHKFGLQSPTRGDRQLEILIVWAALVVGQIVHATLLLRRARGSAG